MKKSLLKLGLIMAAFSMISCASANAASAKENKIEQNSAVAHPFGIDDATYETYLSKTLVTTGNNYRIKEFLKKAENGQTVKIAALGGSVTEGVGPADYHDGYAYQFVKKFTAKYAKGEVIFDGAGLSGTPSMLGLVRYEDDVVKQLGDTPDLLIIEFSVNDDGSSANNRAFEQIIRHSYEANPETAVIALYSAATYGNKAGSMKPIANYYEVPQVNMLPMVNAAVRASLFAQDKYYTDVVHPTKEGHEIQADALMKLLEAIDGEEEKAQIPVPEKSYSTNAYGNFTRITGDNGDVKITAGSFNNTDSATQTIKKTNKGDFSYNWKHTKGTDPFVMKITCKNLIFVWKVQGNWLSEKFGKAELYVDGKLADTYDGGAAGGWCNCEARLVIDEEEAKEHTVEVKMASGDENKGFTIVAMGYSK